MATNASNGDVLVHHLDIIAELRLNCFAKL